MNPTADFVGSMLCSVLMGACANFDPASAELAEPITLRRIMTKALSMGPNHKLTYAVNQHLWGLAEKMKPHGDDGQISLEVLEAVRKERSYEEVTWDEIEEANPRSLLEFLEYQLKEHMEGRALCPRDAAWLYLVAPDYADLLDMFFEMCGIDREKATPAAYSFAANEVLFSSYINMHVYAIKGRGTKHETLVSVKHSAK